MNGDNHEYKGEERRKQFTTEEIEEIKKQILDSIYADIGKNIITRLLWVGGAMAVAAFAWLSGHGYLK